MTAPQAPAPSQVKQDAVTGYFTEAHAPTVIGVTEAQALILTTVDNVGRVLEQVGKSRRLLNKARLLETDPSFQSAAENLMQNLGGTAAAAEQLQNLLISLARYAGAIEAGNAAAQSVVTQLGYVLP